MEATARPLPPASAVHVMVDENDKREKGVTLSAHRALAGRDQGQQARGRAFAQSVLKDPVAEKYLHWRPPPARPAASSCPTLLSAEVIELLRR
jgi:hypothetical protein